MHGEMPRWGETIDGDSAAANKSVHADHIITPRCVGAPIRKLDACCRGRCLFIYVAVAVLLHAHAHAISLLGTNNDIVCPSLVVTDVTLSLQKDKEAREKREITEHRRRNGIK
jgi:hypothetical protein